MITIGPGGEPQISAPLESGISPNVLLAGLGGIGGLLTSFGVNDLRDIGEAANTAAGDVASDVLGEARSALVAIDVARALNSVSNSVPLTNLPASPEGKESLAAKSVVFV